MTFLPSYDKKEKCGLKYFNTVGLRKKEANRIQYFGWETKVTLPEAHLS